MKTLFERLGGSEGISKIVDGVVEAHMNNPSINVRFFPYMETPEKLSEIKRHTVEFFSAGSGGPVEYKGRDMPTAHRGMNITHAEYMHAIDDIFQVLDKHQIDQSAKAEVLSILWSLKDMIIAR
ncbi:group 1 truncated hemoglobin [Christiangramia fulva]|uniref:Group 1 truncated hemoglobin n=1 Tax=Christiangramia fulva TaxID=2126553 RepID=A0A2R3Z4F7_9FLAO|nr:group 1 truncated hemoglobin [Christiangramia fulva]AVR45156.1 group 1 truncated hemoglobin [Christiangramia fulva]